MNEDKRREFAAHVAEMTQTEREERAQAEWAEWVNTGNGDANDRYHILVNPAQVPQMVALARGDEMMRADRHRDARHQAEAGAFSPEGARSEAWRGDHT